MALVAPTPSAFAPTVRLMNTPGMGPIGVCQWNTTIGGPYWQCQIDATIVARDWSRRLGRARRGTSEFQQLPQGLQAKVPGDLTAI